MIKEYYKQQTSIKWRKIGDAILLFSISVSGMIAGLPITDKQAMWAMFVCNLSGIMGKMLTNFFKEEETKSADNE